MPVAFVPSQARSVGTVGRFRGQPANPQFSEIESFSGGTNGAAVGVNDGILDGGTTGTGTWVYDGAVYADSPMGTRIDVTTSSAFNRLIGIAPGAVSQLYAIASFRLSAIPTVITPLLTVRLGATNVAQITITTTGTIRQRDNLTGVGDTTTTVALNRWYTISWWLSVSAAQQSTRLYDDTSTLVETIAPGAFTGGPVDTVNFGFIGAPGIALTGWFDRVGYSTVDWLPPPAFDAQPHPAPRFSGVTPEPYAAPYWRWLTRPTADPVAAPDTRTRVIIAGSETFTITTPVQIRRPTDTPATDTPPAPRPATATIRDTWPNPTATRVLRSTADPAAPDAPPRLATAQPLTAPADVTARLTRPTADPVAAPDTRPRTLSTAPGATPNTATTITLHSAADPAPTDVPPTVRVTLTGPPPAPGAARASHSTADPAPATDAPTKAVVALAGPPPWPGVTLTLRPTAAPTPFTGTPGRPATAPRTEWTTGGTALMVRPTADPTAAVIAPRRQLVVTGWSAAGNPAPLTLRRTLADAVVAIRADAYGTTRATADAATTTRTRPDAAGTGRNRSDATPNNRPTGDATPTTRQTGGAT